MTSRRLSQETKQDLKIHESSQILQHAEGIHLLNQTKSQHGQGEVTINSQHQRRNFSQLITVGEEKPIVLF